MEPIIKVDNVSMCFNLSTEKHESLKEYLLAMVQGRLQYDEFYALRDVSLDIMPGDFYGLVGLNGSGKSTLLKTIAGVYKPSKGKVTVNGTIAPLIELGAGFDMDLTARENIYLNGTVLGFSPKYLDEKFDEIVEFSELQNFLDVPLKNYSSGMVARIGFAIATITKPDILIADEVLAVGDFLFQQKCEKRMKELMAGGTTVILVSHSIEQIERMCSKVAWLSHGHLKMNGDTETVCLQGRAAGRGIRNYECTTQTRQRADGLCRPAHERRGPAHDGKAGRGLCPPPFLRQAGALSARQKGAGSSGRRNGRQDR